MVHQPNLPPPVVINHPLLFAVGTGAWGIALMLMVALDLMGMYRARVWIAVCAVGVVLGVIAIVYTKFSWRTRRPKP
jgi:prepilin signal peptidase PulO-like enzyme (type II secretory pathway)